jgi:hypothetical protein
MQRFKMTVCNKPIYHRPQVQIAAEKGKGVTELGARAVKTVDEIRALWSFLNEMPGQSMKRQTKHKVRSRETARS